MITTTISDFRKDIKKYLDNVTRNFETLIINRGKDTGVVIMSIDEYNSLVATQHELSSKTNEKRLDSAIEKLKSKKAFQKDLLEQWNTYSLMSPGKTISIGRRPIRKPWKELMSYWEIFPEAPIPVLENQSHWNLSIKDSGLAELTESTG